MQEIFDRLKIELELRLMKVRIDAVQPMADDRGTVGKEHEYEGGFVLIAVQHGTSPAP